MEGVSMVKVEHNVLTEYKKVINEDSPSFSGIVAAECMGTLWVDKIDQPNIAIVGSYAVGSYAFLGDLTNKEEYHQLEVFIRDELFPYLKLNGMNYFEFSIESESLKPHILNMFQDKKINSEREFLHRTHDYIDAIDTLPEGFTLHKVDQEYWLKLNKGVYSNPSIISERLLESWESFEEFEHKSLGFCITFSNRIAAVILGTARFHNTIAIDIETEEDYRHRGLGYILTTHFVNGCLSKGLIPQWDAVESNPFSLRLAQKAGFKLFKENDVYWFGI